MAEFFILRAMNDKDPTWERSSKRDSCEIYAESEAHARELAARCFALDEDIARSPWLDADKVECRLAQSLSEKATRRIGARQKALAENAAPPLGSRPLSNGPGKPANGREWFGLSKLIRRRNGR